MTQSVKYDSAICYDSKGNVLQRSNDEKDWENIIPDTIAEVLFTQVCKRFN